MSLTIIFEKMHSLKEFKDLEEVFEKWIHVEDRYVRCFEDLRYCVSIVPIRASNEILKVVLEVFDVEDERVPTILNIAGRDSLSIHIEEHEEGFEVYTGFEELLSFPGIDFVSQIVKVFNENYSFESWYGGTPRIKMNLDSITAESIDTIMNTLLRALMLYRAIIESQRGAAINMAIAFLSKYR